MSKETAPRSEQQLSSEEIIVLKAQFTGEDGNLNLLAIAVCNRIAKDKANHVGAMTGQRPAHESEWLFTNAATTGMILQRIIGMPGDEWPFEHSPAEEFATALSAVQEEATAEDLHG